MPAHSIDRNGSLLCVSKGWLKLLGYAEVEVIGKKSIDFLTEESRREAPDLLAEFYKHGECSEVPYTFVHKDGTEVPVLLSADSVWDGDRFLRSIAILVPIQGLERFTDDWKQQQQTDIQVLLENFKIVRIDKKVVLEVEADKALFDYWHLLVQAASPYFRDVESICLRTHGQGMEVSINLE